MNAHRVTRFAASCDDCDHDFIPYRKTENARKQANLHADQRGHKVRILSFVMELA